MLNLEEDEEEEENSRRLFFEIEKNKINSTKKKKGQTRNLYLKACI